MSEYSSFSDRDNDIPISMFFTEKRLITILKVIPLSRDMKELICWKIIDGMLIDMFQSQIVEESNAYYDTNWV